MRMKKRLLLVAMSLILCVTSVCSIDVSASSYSTYAWPGRPGGNGDGSEEWLQGEYGEPNGPYVLIYSGQGMVSDLGVDPKIEGIASAILSSAVAEYEPRLGAVLTVAGLLLALKAPNYEGASYKMYAYVSGRSMKIVISTYDNSNYTGYRATYTEFLAW